MTAYIIRRLLLVVPTLIGIMTVNFMIIQIAPGGPVEQMIAKLQGDAVSATERISGGGEDIKGQTRATSESSSKYRGAQGLAPELVDEIERMYGFDKPLRSEEHTSELQSRSDLVCRLLLEKKKKKN